MQSHSRISHPHHRPHAGNSNQRSLQSRALRGGIAGLAIASAITGCASIPQPLQGSFAALDPVSAIARDATGQAVRWGGTIAAVDTLSGETCFELVGRPLDDASRPIVGDRADGRFLACRQGFYEPHVFAQGRSVTVTGHVVSYETRKVGEYDYRQPRVAADVVYLWPLRSEVDVYDAHSPWWWHGW